MHNKDMFSHLMAPNEQQFCSSLSLYGFIWCKSRFILELTHPRIINQSVFATSEKKRYRPLPINTTKRNIWIWLEMGAPLAFIERCVNTNHPVWDYEKLVKVWAVLNILHLHIPFAMSHLGHESHRSKREIYVYANEQSNYARADSRAGGESGKSCPSDPQQLQRDDGLHFDKGNNIFLIGYERIANMAKFTDQC